ncbi:MAG: hypothetical protein L3J69_16665 [Desulfobacula sp.]|nr:hypothetical protein [Desulfobacula sp.]
MKMMIGGAIAVVLALFGFTAFPAAFLKFLAGVVPILLILTGGLAIYVGRDQVNEADELENEPGETEMQVAPDPELEAEPDPEPEAEVEPEVEPIEAEFLVEETPGSSETAIFVGNADTLVFHTSDCKFSKSKKCTASFKTKGEALEKGYKPCGVCKP